MTATAAARALALAFLVTALAGLASGRLPVSAQAARTTLADEVRRAEAAFAQSMADRDHAAFISHLAADAVFFGEKTVFRGRDAVAAGWRPLYDAPTAPFSWRPDTVEVLDSGTLALSSGPVFNPKGERTGTFSSIWRREPNGEWKVVFDKGCPACNCP